MLRIHSSGTAFAALKEDSSVVIWGRKAGGGEASKSIRQQLTCGVFELHARAERFAAVKESGVVICWGSGKGLCEACNDKKRR